MPSYVITEKCDGCKAQDKTACQYICPNDLMTLNRDLMKAYNQEPDQCWECYNCVKMPAAGDRDQGLPGLRSPGRERYPDAGYGFNYVDHQVPEREAPAL